MVHVRLYVQLEDLLVESIRNAKRQIQAKRRKAQAQAQSKSSKINNGEINMENKFIVSSSPHIRSNEDTSYIMKQVIFALVPAALCWIVVFLEQAHYMLCFSVY